jgi:hypothetical protein
MDSPTRAAHKFNIWKLAGLGEAPARGAVDLLKPDATTSAPVARGLTDASRHPSARMARPTLRPFTAKCVLPSGLTLPCETKRVGPERIDVMYTEARVPSLTLSLEARVALELEYFGLIHGTIRATNDTGFSVAPDIIYHGMLVAKLAELYAPSLGLENERSDLDRLTARITLRNPACVYRVIESDAVIYHAKIALLSHKVATLRTAHIQRAGTRVLLGWPNARPGIVARCFESGFTIEFDEMLEELHEDLNFG